MLSPRFWPAQRPPRTGEALPVSDSCKCEVNDAGSGGVGNWPAQLAKVTSSENAPWLLIAVGVGAGFGSASPVSWAAEAVRGRMPLTKMSRRLIVWTTESG